MENEHEKLIEQLKSASAFIKQLSMVVRDHDEPYFKANQPEMKNMEVNFFALLAVLSWSTLSTDELNRYIGAFRYELLNAMEVISEPNVSPEELKAHTPTGRQQVLYFMQRVDQRLIHWISVVSGHLPKPLMVMSGGTYEGFISRNYPNTDHGLQGSSFKSAVAESKIVTLFSVKQLGFWIRLQKEHGIIESENIALLVRLFSRYYQTRRAENISDRSLYNDYFDTNQFDAAVIRSVLKDMLDRLNKQYFP